MKQDSSGRLSWLGAFSRAMGGITAPRSRMAGDQIEDRCARVLLVARTRWVMLSVLALYGFCASAGFSLSRIGFFFTPGQLLSLTVPAVVVALYNGVLCRSCEKFKNLPWLVHVQVALDLLCVTVIIHVTGGIVSWFWPMYLLVTLESAFLFERRWDVWSIGTLGSLLYGVLLLAEALHVLTPGSMPFIDVSLYDDALYQSLHWLWVSGVNAAVAIIGAYLMDVLRGEHVLVKESSDALLGFVNSAHDIIFCCRTDGTILYANSICRGMLGIDSLSATPRSIYDFVDPASRETMMQIIAADVCDEAPRQLELQFTACDAPPSTVEMNLSVAPMNDGDRVFWGVCRDVTERKNAQDELYRLAHHDILTGLPNRALLKDRLLQAMAFCNRSGSRFALMFLDLDRFKIINDTLGHSIGDELLRLVSLRLKGILRDMDTVARIGGDEFIILLTGISQRDDAVLLADKIMRSMAHYFRLAEHELFVTASLGVSLYPDNGGDGEELMKKADIAMYHAKAQGRNNIQFYSDAMDKNTSRHFIMSNGLKRALENDEFRVHYQPKVDINSGRIVAMEALVRWQHPELGLLSPIEFIHLAEESGLIMQLGEWVLMESCRQTVQWQAEGITGLRVAVNLSGYQLQHASLLDTIRRVLKESGMAPDLLELEITESVIMQNPDFAVSVLADLSRIGIHISIDDFGTGYSSLAHLKRFSVNTLKIDKSFVRDVSFNSTDAAIASAIIAMGNNLKLNVIAEGVETEEQFRFLKENNCNQVQGYLICRPLPPDELLQLLRENRGDAGSVQAEMESGERI